MKNSKKKGVKQVLILALIKMSGIGVTEISGKAGGTVFSRGRGGAYVRNRVVPSNPQTIAQQAVRAVFGAISSAWRTLTAEQREAWNAITSDYPTQNRLGETKILSGKALFQKLNMNLLEAGQSLATSPTAPQGVNGPVSVNLQNVGVEEGVFDLGVNATLANSGDNTTQIVVEATPPLSPGVKNANSKFVRIAVETAVNSALQVSSTTLGSAYVEVFGLPPIGSQIQVRVFSVNPATGEKSSAMTDSNIVIEP